MVKVHGDASEPRLESIVKVSTSELEGEVVRMLDQSLVNVCLILSMPPALVLGCELNDDVS